MVKGFGKCLPKISYEEKQNWVAQSLWILRWPQKEVMEESGSRLDLKKEAPRKVGERGPEEGYDSILLGAGSTR